MRKNQSHLEVSGPAVLKSVPKTSGFLLVFLLLTSVCVGGGGCYAVFHFQRNLSNYFNSNGKKMNISN